MDNIQLSRKREKMTQGMAILQLAQAVGNQAVIQGRFYDTIDKPLTANQIKWNQIRDRINSNPNFFENFNELNEDLDIIEETAADNYLITIISMSIKANIKKISENFVLNSYDFKDMKTLFGEIKDFLNVKYTVNPGMQGHSGINYILKFCGVTVEAFVAGSTHGKDTGNLHSIQGEIRQSLRQIDTLMIAYIMGEVEK